MEWWPVWVLAALAVAAIARYVWARGRDAAPPAAPASTPAAQDWQRLRSDRERDWHGHHAQTSVPRAPMAPTPARAALPPQFAWMPGDLVVIDVETAGFDRERHQILQVGAVRLRRDAIAAAGELQLDTGTWYCQPEEGTRISAKITEVTGLTRAHLLKEGRPLADVMREVRQFVGAAGVVAFNAPFDRAFVERDFARFGLPPAARWHCALMLARQVLPGLPSYKLAALCELLQIDNQRAHDALSDASATTVLLLALAPRASRLPTID